MDKEGMVVDMVTDMVADMGGNNHTDNTTCSIKANYILII
jgi:hypothetical protein